MTMHFCGFTSSFDSAVKLGKTMKKRYGGKYKIQKNSGGWLVWHSKFPY